MAVGSLVAAAFMQARSKYPELNKTWIEISFRAGGRLPASLLMVNIQRDGELDLVVRCMEDEVSKDVECGGSDDLFVGNYLSVLSNCWAGSVYEVFRLLRERGLGDDNPLFGSILTDLELLRMPLEKHQIAKDRVLKEPLAMMRYPKIEDDKGYVYDCKDPQRAHIMPQGISPRGSMMWQVIDVRTNQSYWIERRTLSDRIIELWGSTFKVWFNRCGGLAGGVSGGRLPCAEGADASFCLVWRDQSLCLVSLPAMLQSPGEPIPLLLR